MAKSWTHIDQWKHNRAFISTIPLSYPDWIINAVFYTALHAVDSLRAFDNNPVSDHRQRNDVLLRTNKYMQVNRFYHPLHDLSLESRYQLGVVGTIDIPTIEKRVIERYLYPIEKSVQSLIHQNLELPKIILAHGSAVTPKG